MKFSILPNSWLVNSASTGIHCTFNAHAGTHSCYAVIGASIPREDKVWSPGIFTYTIYPSLYPSVYHLYTHVIIPYNISRSSMCWCRHWRRWKVNTPPMSIWCHEAWGMIPCGEIEETGLYISFWNHQTMIQFNHQKVLLFSTTQFLDV